MLRPKRHLAALRLLVMPRVDSMLENAALRHQLFIAARSSPWQNCCCERVIVAICRDGWRVASPGGAQSRMRRRKSPDRAASDQPLRGTTGPFWNRTLPPIRQSGLRSRFTFRAGSRARFIRPRVAPHAVSYLMHREPGKAIRARPPCGGAGCVAPRAPRIPPGSALPPVWFLVDA